jgi:hypothetical protein
VFFQCLCAARIGKLETRLRERGGGGRRKTPPEKRGDVLVDIAQLPHKIPRIDPAQLAAPPRARRLVPTAITIIAKRPSVKVYGPEGEPGPGVL